MAVTVTNAEAQVAYGALMELSRLMLPPAGALRVRHLLRDLRPHLQDVEAERMKILEAYASKDDQGRVLAKGPDGTVVAGGDGPVVFTSDEAEAAANEAYAELMAATWTTDHPIREADLGTTTPMRAEPLVALGDLLVAAEEAKRP